MNFVSLSRYKDQQKSIVIFFSSESKGVSYITSQRGTTQLKINGHTFTRSQVRSRIIIWVCTQRRAHGCKARATTCRFSQGRLVSMREDHSHGIITWRNVRRTRMVK
uniref:(northern house mosquito) hypothetical protein n=1 Tax=Culex pipiens TaxID=7175 RepID=A0A8D8CKN0_CULPI